jgi:Cytidylate kinase-like family
MSSSAIDVVTIAREFGAGGSELAEALGARLGWPVLDRELPERVARRLRLEPATVARLDEHAPNFLSRVASAMLVCPPEAPLFVDTSEMLSPDAVAEAARAELLEAVESPPLVVVGHGAQCLFRDRVGTLHVRLVAPPAARIARLRRRLACDDRSAAAALRRVDEERESYVRRYFDAEWRDPMLYDLQINTGRMTIPDAAALVAALVEQRASR